MSASVQVASRPTPTPAPCPVCGAARAALLAEGADFEYDSLPGPFRFWQCGACGHAYLHPLPTEEELSVIYPPTYYTVNPRSPIHFDGLVQRVKMRRDVDRILSMAGERPIREVADLGCGDGERLLRLGERLAARTGAAPGRVGVDLQPDPERARLLRARGVEVVQANLEGGLGTLADDRFDLVLMCQILEHLRDPVAALRSVARKLAPGGLLLLETPNLGGIDYRLFGDRHWGGYHFPRHFHIFTVDTLRDAAERAGLRARRRGFLPSGFGIVSLRNRLGLSSVERGRRFGEFIHMRNLAVVGSVTAVEMLTIALGGATSNQYLLAERPADGAPS